MFHEHNLHARRPIKISVYLVGISRRTRNFDITKESRFVLQPNSRGLRMWRTIGNASRLQTVDEIDRYQGETLMVSETVS